MSISVPPHAAHASTPLACKREKQDSIKAGVRIRFMPPASRHACLCAASQQECRQHTNFHRPTLARRNTCLTRAAKHSGAEHASDKQPKLYLSHSSAHAKVSPQPFMSISCRHVIPKTVNYMVSNITRNQSNNRYNTCGISPV
jgi:hypothetical protein